MPGAVHGRSSEASLIRSGSRGVDHLESRCCFRKNGYHPTERLHSFYYSRSSGFERRLGPKIMTTYCDVWRVADCIQRLAIAVLCLVYHAARGMGNR